MADVEQLRADAEAADVEDFEAFWSQQSRRGARLSNVFGVDVELPASMPLRFEMEAQRVQRSQSEEDVRRMVGILFGDDALDRWTEAGMDAEQFAVLLLWGSSNVAGTPMTLAEAREHYHARESGGGKQGKAPAKAKNTRTRGGSSKKAGR